MVAEREIIVAQKMPSVPVRIAISEHRHSPTTAKQARFTCDKCGGMSFVTIPWNATAMSRSKLMKAAVDEHRYICPKGLPEDMRVYTITYPTK